MASASDDFNRADAATLGANWTHGDSTFDGPDIVSNQARGDTVVALDSAFYSGVAFADDHESQITKGNASNYQGPAVRVGIGGGTGQGYVYFNHGSVQKVVIGTNSQIAAATAFTNGQTAKLRIVGDDLEWFINGVSDGTVTDATHATGEPGIYFYDNAGTIDDWSGSDELTGINIPVDGGVMALAGIVPAMNYQIGMPDEP